MKTVMVIVGTRPEAIKLCPVILELRQREELRTVVLSTGQHGALMESAMACFGVCADETLPQAGGGGLECLTGGILSALGAVFDRVRPDLCVVQGDTASAFAGALAGFYRGVPVAHVEAGLRTYHIRSPFPEEMHRQVITTLADLHFAPTVAAKRNLLRAGVSEKRVYLTGNTVIDALRYSLVEGKPKALPEFRKGVRMLLFTAHRRESWGEPLREMLYALRETVEAFPDTFAVCPLHPNPAVRQAAGEILGDCPRISVIDPPELTTFHHLLARAFVVLTDSGGIQEEATALGIPTLVLRHSTERQEGLRAGVLRLAGTDRAGIVTAARELLLPDSEVYAAMHRPSGVFGDGQASRRIVRILEGWMKKA